jgi:hypothetical protein
MAVAVTALFVALGGSGYAAVQLTHSSRARQAVLPSGQTESGAFSAGGANSSGSGGFLGAGITYQIPLGTAIANGHIIDTGSHPTSLCPGPGRAARGYLCLYDTQLYSNVDDGYGYSSNVGYFSHPSPGVVLYFHVTGSAPYVGGEWTVRAP